MSNKFVVHKMEVDEHVSSFDCGDEDLNDFEQIIDDRYGDKAIVIAGQLPVEDWYNVFQSELIADACMDRLINNKTIKFSLNGESLRKKY